MSSLQPGSLMLYRIGSSGELRRGESIEWLGKPKLIGGTDAVSNRLDARETESVGEDKGYEVDLLGQHF